MDSEVDALTGGWKPPSTWRKVATVDAHAAGEPFRVVLDGVEEPLGRTVLERRRDAGRRLDGIRRGLMWEPRGHADMYGGFLTPPSEEDSDFGILFLHNEGFSTMCGHGIIAVATVVVECGLIPGRVRSTDVGEERELRIDTPAGTVVAWARVEEGRVRRVRFRNVASFVVALGETVDVPEHGTLRYDLAYGGAYYAYVDVADLGLEIEPEQAASLIEWGRVIRQAVSETRPIDHPGEIDLGYLYGVIFVSPARAEGVHSRNACVFADGEIDRSPTGTGVSGRLAIHHRRGEVQAGEEIVIESILGSTFSGKVVAETEVADRPAIVPEVSGSAWITGRHEFFFAPDDPFREGFLIR